MQFIIKKKVNNAKMKHLKYLNKISQIKNHILIFSKE